MPFLQRVLDDFSLIPLIVGDAEGEDVAQVIETLVADDILIVVSSDLSHYHGYAEAQRRDANTTGMIEAMSIEVWQSWHSRPPFGFSGRESIW